MSICFIRYESIFLKTLDLRLFLSAMFLFEDHFCLRAFALENCGCGDRCVDSRHAKRRVAACNDVKRRATCETQVKRMNMRRLLQQSVNFGLVVCSALMIWKSLMIVVRAARGLHVNAERTNHFVLRSISVCETRVRLQTGSESPIVVVLRSGGGGVKSLSLAGKFSRDLLTSSLRNNCENRNYCCRFTTQHQRHCSGSMEPAFWRGDLLLLTLPKDEPCNKRTRRDQSHISSSHEVACFGFRN